jgi:release factor glutamine methyltransferase
MAKTGLTFDQLRREAARHLSELGIETSAVDAKLLLTHAAGYSAAELIANGGEKVPAAVYERFETMLARRQAREPIAYIVGKQAFWSLEFTVDQNVLIPRPETEGVVECALDLIKNIPTPTICDIGTGSGAILISLLHERQYARGVGVDISTNALEIARKNAEIINVADRITFLKSDYLEEVVDQFDLIVSNPPYITDEAMLQLATDVHRYEPGLALEGGRDGLQAYRRIINGLAAKLTPGGFVVFEIGYDQGDDVSKLLSEQGFSDILVGSDLAGHDRVVSAKLSA